MSVVRFYRRRGLYKTPNPAVHNSCRRRLAKAQRLGNKTGLVAHAASMGARAQKVVGVAELDTALAAARGRAGVDVVVIDTDALATTAEGGHWWDVAVPEVSSRDAVRDKRAAYEAMIRGQR